MLKQELVKKQNEFQVQLDELESSLLKELSDADPATILDNKDLINNLEKTWSFGVSWMLDSVGPRFHDDSPLRNKYYTCVQCKKQGEIIEQGRFAEDILDAKDVI